MSREELIELRPLIPSALVDDTKELEHFQNEVLRPIIKYQHVFIEMYFKANEQFQELIKQKKSRLEFQEKVKHFIGNQANIKHQLIGAILGLLTEKELVFYWKNASDLNKRIHQMVRQRVSDTFY
jgi:hypothetical protein